MCYQQGLPDESGLTSSPSGGDAPTRKMLSAALRSRSCTVPQALHCHVLSRRFNASFTAPQTEHVLLEGYHLSMKVSLTPFFLAIYTNFLTKSANPKSLTLHPQRAFMPRRFKSQAVSRRIHRSGGVPTSNGNPPVGVQSCGVCVLSQAVHVHGSLIFSSCVNAPGLHV